MALYKFFIIIIIIIMAGYLVFGFTVIG